MKQSLFDGVEWSGFEWHDSDGHLVMRTQTEKATGRSILTVGFPFVSNGLSKPEALAIAESFAPTVAVMLADMRAELAKMRGGQ